MEGLRLGKTYTIKNLYEEGKRLKKFFPKTFTEKCIGLSRKDNEIYTYRIGTGEQAFLFVGGVHARETINPPVLYRVMERYLSEITLQDFFTQVSFYFIPLLNPDGYELALFNPEFAEWKENGTGVDLNHNFPSKSYEPEFPGDLPASEPETRALIKLCNEVNFLGMIDFHSRGKEIYYYRHHLSEEYNKIQKKIADKLSIITGYHLVLPENEFAVGTRGGNSVHYFSETHKQSAITIETVAEEKGFPLDPKLQAETYREIYRVPYYFASCVLSTSQILVS